MRILPRVALSLALSASTVAAAGCSGPARFHPPKPLFTAPEPAAAPPLSATPAGTLIAVGSAPEGLVATADGTIAVAVRGASPGLDLIHPGSSVPVLVPLPGEARHLALGGPDGPVLFPDEVTDRLFMVSPVGKVTGSYPTGRQPHDAAALDGSVAVADEFGNSVTLIRPGRPSATVPAPLQPGGVAAGADGFVVVGVRARVLAAYRPDGSLIDRAACGAGPTHVVAGPDGYFYVTDTNGGRLLVFRLHGGRLARVAGPDVGARPYGIAVDPVGHWVYVTLTGSNQLIGLHFAGDRVTARRSWPTGRQPNSVAVDYARRSIVVTATATDQLQLIPMPAAPAN